MISRFDPFRDALSLRRAMDELFEQSFVHPSMMRGGASQIAPMDVIETANGYEVDVALPGVRPEDIELTVHENTLTIRGHYSHQNARHDQPQDQGQAQGQQGESSQGQQEQGRSQRRRNVIAREITSGTFERTISLPKPIDSDKIQTQFQNGMLTLQVPVAEASRPRRINISGGSSQSSQQVDSTASSSTSGQSAAGSSEQSSISGESASSGEPPITTGQPT